MCSQHLLDQGQLAQAEGVNQKQCVLLPLMHLFHAVMAGIVGLQQHVHITVDGIYLVLQHRGGILPLAQVIERVTLLSGLRKAFHRPNGVGQHFVENLEGVVVFN